VRLQECRRTIGNRLYRVESGIFEGLRTNEAFIFYRTSPPRARSPKSMDQMIGDWSMVRGNGRPVCGLTLTNTEATPDNFAVFLKPRCDPAVAAFAPTVWRLEARRVVADVAKR